MQSVRSCFNFALYKKNMARFWPIWGLYTLIWLFMLPVSLLSDLVRYADGGLMSSDLALWASQWAAQAPITRMAGGGGLALALCYGVVVAMAVWSYLYNNRSANLIHALPLRREGLFLTNFLSGVSFFLVPHLIVFVLTLPAELAAGAVDVGALALCFGYQTLLCLFFFCFATLCAMLTGHILALPAFYIIFNGLVAGVAFLLDWTMSNFLFGFTSWLADTALIAYLTPLAGLIRDFDWRWVDEAMIESGNNGARAVLTGEPTVWIYAGAGLVLAALALLLYRHRHLEAAGDVVAVPWLRPVFKYSVAFCTALSGACVLYSMLSLTGTPAFVVCLLLWGLAGYFIAEMLLHKSFRVLRKGWKGGAVAAAALVLLSAAMELDLLQIEGRVPDPSDVVMVNVQGIDSAPYDSANYLRLYEQSDPDLIDRVIALHQAIVDRRGELENAQHTVNHADAVWDSITHTYSYVNITYTLSSGAQMTRQYSYVPFSAAELEEPGSITWAAAELVNDPTVVDQVYGLEDLRAHALTYVQVAPLRDGTRNTSIILSETGNAPVLAENASVAADVEYSVTWAETADHELSVTAQQLESIRQAVLADFTAGRLGTRYLFSESQQRNANTCLADLELYFELPAQERDGTYYTYTHAITVTLTPDATDTILALKQAGVFSTGLALIDNNGNIVYQDTEALLSTD